MRALAVAGLIALAFGLGSYYATGEFGTFSWLNLGLGMAALAVSGAARARRLRQLVTPAARRVLLPRVLVLLASLLVGFGLERGLEHTVDPFDWTMSRRFQLAPATCEAVASLQGAAHATLFYERHDPRTRRIRLLLGRIADCGALEVRQRLIDEAEEEVERFDLAYSNSVVLELGDRFTVVERTTEGSLLEGLLQLSGGRKRPLYVARGEGEGDPSRGDEHGYSGLAVALHNEGYLVHELVTAAITRVPPDAALVLLIAPRRDLRDSAYAAFDAHLEAGGRMLVLADPDGPPGLAAFLARWGFELPRAIVIDPASGPSEGALPGVNPIAHVYADHPITHGLSSGTMTFFLGARPVLPVRKPAPEDRLEGLVYTSPRSWLSPDVEASARGVEPRRPDGAPSGRFPLVASGRYPRGQVEGRLVVVGDSDFASNHYLRALYNLDLVMNAVHWLAERESAITLRPKATTPNQEPLTPQQTLAMLYGVGLLLPELLLIASALAWIRRREA